MNYINLPSLASTCSHCLFRSDNTVTRWWNERNNNNLWSDLCGQRVWKLMIFNERVTFHYSHNSMSEMRFYECVGRWRVFVTMRFFSAAINWSCG